VATRLTEKQRLRRARIFLAVLGFVFAALAILIGAGSVAVPSYALLVCATLSILLLLISRFASDQWVLRCESLLTGWP
jgi:hypothetical protein